MTQAPDTQAEHPLVGQTIAGKYKVVRLLGEGGMGCVYQGEQMLGTTARKVAVKTLHKHLSHDESIKARFKREVGTVAALEHPNTIQVFDFGTMEDGTLYIVMEFVQGRSVADVLEKDGAMPPERVLNILRQVAGSLEEAHGHGIVHRDLKPDNVVLAERAGQKDWVEVLDFGIAKRSSEHDPNEAKLTQQGMVLGTPPYMSPEQFTGQPVDVRSDIYALGVMAYEMLTGRLPWVANTAWEWASKHMTEAPTPLERQPLGPNVPDAMRSAITRALAKNKDERFSTVREFFDAFSGGTVAPVSLPHGGGHPPATAAMGAPPVGDASPRMKTEMGAPVMGGAPPGAMSPPYGSPSAGAAAPAVVPAGPAHSPGAAKKGGPPMLVIGLGALALLLFVGAGLGLAMRGKKPTPTTAFDPSGSTSATAASSMAAAEEPPPAVVSAAPLDSSGMKVPAVPNNNASGGASKGTTAKSVPTPTPPTPTPVPTPQPAKTEPEVCKKAREAKATNRPAAVIKVLESQCRSAGGTP
ncbi:MAG TPA: serine/threonine-protein kinase [Labilithrix sp.]|nr:serine/threonine-protein kinase [Labilithrix sp.]